MTNIIERLRAEVDAAYGKRPAGLLSEAADEIEQLRQEVATLRAMHQSYRDEIVEHLREIAQLRSTV